MDNPDGVGTQRGVGTSSNGGGTSSSHDFTALEPTTLLVKVERLRRLYKADDYVHTVRRGEDGTFGLGLSEDNEIIAFYHEQNTDKLRLGDQVRSVGSVPLVREKLAVLLQRHFSACETVELHISRSSFVEEKVERSGEVFAALELRDRRGENLDEWTSELWELKTDAVWGTFWTVPILPRTHTICVGLHESHLFSEPLIGCVEIPIASLAKETLDCRWYALRAEDAEHDSREIEGEILLTTRRFYSSASICPDRAAFSESDSDDDWEPSGPVTHESMPMSPIDEPADLAVELAVAHGSRR